MSKRPKNSLLRYASMNPLCLRAIQESLENRLVDVACLLAPYSGIPSLPESLETIGKALHLADSSVNRNGMADAGLTVVARPKQTYPKGKKETGKEDSDNAGGSASGMTLERTTIIH